MLFLLNSEETVKQSKEKVEAAVLSNSFLLRNLEDSSVVLFPSRA